jgi:protein-L-isoaspartate(D-aspartate) O-methyltransferase
MPDYTVQRLNMVESQVRTNDVADVRIPEAMREIPREQFVPGPKRALAYAENVVELVPGRYLLDPRTFSKLAQLAEIRPNDAILDVGCASGYSSAVLARLGGKVIALEEDAELIRIASDALPSIGERVTVVQGKLSDGYRARAPYDVIFLGGAVEAVPNALKAQLAEGGRLITVIRKGPLGRAHLFVREHGRVGSRPDFDANVPILPGFREPAGFVF